MSVRDIQNEAPDWNSRWEFFFFFLSSLIWNQSSVSPSAFIFLHGKRIPGKLNGFLSSERKNTFFSLKNGVHRVVGTQRKLRTSNRLLQETRYKYVNNLHTGTGFIFFPGKKNRIILNNKLFYNIAYSGIFSSILGFGMVFGIYNRIYLKSIKDKNPRAFNYMFEIKRFKNG